MVVDRYLVVMVPGLLLWLAQGLQALPRPALLIGLSAFLLAWVPALWSYYNSVGISSSAEMRSFQRDVSVSDKGALVLSNLSASDPYFQWYAPELPLIPTHASALDYTHAASFDSSRAGRELEVALNENREVWLLGLGYPAAPAAISTERTLEASSYRLAESWYGSVRWLRYRSSDEDVRPLNLQFRTPEGVLRAAAYSISPDLAAGYVGLRLDWEPQASVSSAYGVFVHLIDATGEKFAQGDSDPQWGYAPTTTWQPGQTIVDRHVVRLPQELPDGSFRIILGLYDDRGRLPLPGGDNSWTTPPFDLPRHT
jgi:hypothetical protein